MKRYLIFGGQSFYPCGGFADLVGDADTVGEAATAAAAMEGVRDAYGQCVEWWHVIDTETRECVRESETKPLGGGMEGRLLFHRVYVDGQLVPVPAEMPC